MAVPLAFCRRHVAGLLDEPKAPANDDQHRHAEECGQNEIVVWCPRRCHGKVDGLGAWAVGQPHAADFLCASSVPGRDHPAWLSPGARSRNLLRNQRVGRRSVSLSPFRAGDLWALSPGAFSTACSKRKSSRSTPTAAQAPVPRTPSWLQAAFGRAGSLKPAVAWTISGSG